MSGTYYPKYERRDSDPFAGEDDAALLGFADQEEPQEITINELIAKIEATEE